MDALPASTTRQADHAFRTSGPIHPGHPLYVDTHAARNTNALKEVRTLLGASGPGACALLCGQPGSGLSTELRGLKHTLRGEDGMSVRFIEIQEADHARAGELAAHALSSGDDKSAVLIMDGLDRLPMDMADVFFMEHAHMLSTQGVSTVMAAPLHIMNHIKSRRLPMHGFALPHISLRAPYTGEPSEHGRAALRSMLLMRASESLFAGEDAIEAAIDASGGSPGELMKVMHYAYLATGCETYGVDEIERGMDRRAEDFRWLLAERDYEALYRTDNSMALEQNTARERYLLAHNALMHYSGFRRMSHPALRRLTSYVSYGHM